jgi:hypothetical protein
MNRHTSDESLFQERKNEHHQSCSSTLRTIEEYKVRPVWNLLESRGRIGEVAPERFEILGPRPTRAAKPATRHSPMRRPAGGYW